MNQPPNQEASFVLIILPNSHITQLPQFRRLELRPLTPDCPLLVRFSANCSEARQLIGRGPGDVPVSAPRPAWDSRIQFIQGERHQAEIDHPGRGAIDQSTPLEVSLLKCTLTWDGTRPTKWD